MKLKELFDPKNIQGTLKILREDGFLPQVVEPFVYVSQNHFLILKEMTQSMGPMPGAFVAIENQVLDDIQKHGSHVGDQDMFPIFHYQMGTAEYYGVVQDNKIVSYIYVEKHPQIKRLYGWHNAFASPPYRNQQHSKRLLYFIKSKMGYSIFDASGQQSPHGIQLVQSIGRDRRFKVSWINMKTGERSTYNPTEDHDEHQPYRSKEAPTDWRILVESRGPCAKNHLFITNNLRGLTYLSGRAPNSDRFNISEAITYDKLKESLSFYFDNKRQRRVI